MHKSTRSVTSKAIATLTSKLLDLLRTCTWSLPIQEDLMEMVSVDDVAHDVLVNATNYLTDIAIFLGLRLIKLMLPVEAVADELWSVLWKNRVCYLGAEIHQTLIAHTFECFTIKPAYGYGELLDVLIERFGDPSFDRKLMNRIVRLFLKASCLKKFRETSDDVLVSLSDNISSLHEFEMRHNTTIVRLLLIEGQCRPPPLSVAHRDSSRFFRISLRSGRIFRIDRRQRFIGGLREKFHGDLVFEL